MYQKQIDDVKFKFAHASGLKDSELADQFHISLATVKRHRSRLSLGSNCPNNNRGKLAEQLAAEYFIQVGHRVSLPKDHNAPFDLLVGGHRIDVKLGRKRESKRGSRTYEYRLPCKRHSYQMAFEYHKDYQRDADFLALVVLTEDDSQLAHLYLLPTTHWKPTINLSPENPFCPFQLFRNVITPLSVPSAA